MKGYFRFPMLDKIDSALVFGDGKWSDEFVAGISYHTTDKDFRFVYMKIRKVR